MPEAAVDKDHFAAPRETDIRPAGEILRVKPVTIAQTIKQPPSAHFGARVCASITAHCGPNRN